MSYGQYSDDPLEDSLFRDDELRMREELENEIENDRSYGRTEDEKKNNLLPGLFLVALVVGFLLWFFFG